jgi:competence protein ComEC
LLPWVPIAFGTGIALYFTADHEPVAWVAAATAAALCVTALLLRRHALFPVAVMIAAVAAGFAVGALKTARVSHAVLMRPVYVPLLNGFVETREVRERTDRFVLRVVEMDDPWRHTKLDRVRLSVRKDTAPAVGSFVELKARLQPPLAPMRPGSYDFGRDMFFQGIGASGFVMGAIKVVTPPNSGGLALRYATLMQDFRDTIDARIRLVLSGDSRAIATALLTGRRDAITTPVNDALFISGLGHVLSISGYHMAVVAGVVFFAIRALLALIPALTVTFPIKKWSAAGALLAAAFYLLLSGAEVATQRSFFMTAVVLIAVMVDRRAITFRTLAVAAMIVLAIAPEALVHPSFQMSFAATLGLVALVQMGMPKLFASPDHSPTARAALWGGREIVTLALASFVAGLATTPCRVSFSSRDALWRYREPARDAGCLGAGDAGRASRSSRHAVRLRRCVLAPDGFRHRMDDRGIAMGGGAARRHWPHGRFWDRAADRGNCRHHPARPAEDAAALERGGCHRACVAWSLAVKQPDILVSADGHNVGVRGRDGRLHLMRTTKDTFMVREWLAADADGRLPADPALAEGVSCDDAGCVVEMAGGGIVALAQRPEALEDDCARAAVVVTPWQAPTDCGAEVIDSERLRRQGALALRRTQGSMDGSGKPNFSVTAIRPKGVDRPWSPAVGDDRQHRGTAGGAPARPVDATPAAADLRPDD